MNSQTVVDAATLDAEPGVTTLTHTGDEEVPPPLVIITGRCCGSDFELTIRVEEFDGKRERDNAYRLWSSVAVSPRSDNRHGQQAAAHASVAK